MQKLIPNFFLNHIKCCVRKGQLVFKKAKHVDARCRWGPVPRGQRTRCVGGGEVPIYPRDTYPTQTVTCLQVVAHIEPLGLVHGPPYLFFLFDPQTQWTPTISLLHFPKTRTHRTRVSPYSRDFLVPCWTPPPLFWGYLFLLGRPTINAYGIPPLLLLHTHIWIWCNI